MNQLCLPDIFLHTGAIYADTAEINIDGDTVFMNNSAQLDGGEAIGTKLGPAP